MRPRVAECERSRAVAATVVCCAPGSPSAGAADDAPDKADFKIQEAAPRHCNQVGASRSPAASTSTIQMGRTDLKGVDSSRGGSAPTAKATSTASFFDADLANSIFGRGCGSAIWRWGPVECRPDQRRLTTLTTGAVLNGPKGKLTKIDNSDWTDAELRKDQRTYLYSAEVGAKGTNPKTGVPRASSARALELVQLQV